MWSGLCSSSRSKSSPATALEAPLGRHAHESAYPLRGAQSRVGEAREALGALALPEVDRDRSPPPGSSSRASKPGAVRAPGRCRPRRRRSIGADHGLHAGSRAQQLGHALLGERHAETHERPPLEVPIVVFVGSDIVTSRLRRQSRLRRTAPLRAPRVPPRPSAPVGVLSASGPVPRALLPPPTKPGAAPPAPPRGSRVRTVLRPQLGVRREGPSSSTAAWPAPVVEVQARTQGQLLAQHSSPRTPSSAARRSWGRSTAEAVAPARVGAARARRLATAARAMHRSPSASRSTPPRAGPDDQRLRRRDLVL